MSVIELRGVYKHYRRYRRPMDRAIEVITGRPRHDTTVALEPLDLTVSKGEVLGVIGLNGAGKSTLLKLIAGTLSPSGGELIVSGRISALLELGTGFHPAMSARENVMLSCAAAGLSLAQAKTLYEEIVDFSGLAPEVMAQPIKTFSSGMMARLAFSVATAVQPEVLIVDEILSVGDGVFARRSFERIMEFKRAGKTMLFCSHSMFHVESICSRVLWLHQGMMRMEGQPAEVVIAYNAFLASVAGERGGTDQHADDDAASLNPVGGALSVARLTRVVVDADGTRDHVLSVVSGSTGVKVSVEFSSDPAIPSPSLAVRISDANGRTVASMGTVNDGISTERDLNGQGRIQVVLPAFPLLKGNYWVNVVLLSEDGIHVYDRAPMVAELKVEQVGLEQGLVRLPRQWIVAGGASPETL